MAPSAIGASGGIQTMTPQNLPVDTTGIIRVIGIHGSKDESVSGQELDTTSDTTIDFLGEVVVNPVTEEVRTEEIFFIN
jgi:hypothetical protein